jgi:hypothetical protein
VGFEALPAKLLAHKKTMASIETLFDLSEVEESDTDALLHVRVAAFANDPLWQHLNINTSYDGQFLFMKQIMKMQFVAEDKVTFKITEKATGCVFLLSLDR